MNVLRKYLSRYAETNYAEYAGMLRHNSFIGNRLSTRFADASRMDSIPGDMQNSLLSTQRVGFYGEAAALLGGYATFLSSIAEVATRDELFPGQTAWNIGGFALIATGAWVGHQARQAISDVVKSSL